MLVVARYNEDISWTNDFENVVIYNKGSFLENSIPLPNVGRESHSYLYHIINNYHCLDDVMMFSQGDYKQHTGLSLKEFKEKMLDVELGYSLLYDASRLAHGHDLSNREEFTYMNHHGSEVANRKGYNLKEWWESTLQEDYKISEYVFWGGIFSVKKEFILKRSLDDYIKLYLSLNYHNNPIEGQFCERTWFNIFGLEEC